MNWLKRLTILTIVMLPIVCCSFPDEQKILAAEKPTATSAPAPRAESTMLQITVNGPTTTTVGMAVFFQLDVTADIVDWKLLPANANCSFFAMQNYAGQTPDGKPIIRHVAFFSTTEPGTYYFAIAASTPTQLGHVIHTLTVTGTSPTPTPTPTPTPEPDPNPTLPPNLALMVRESGEQTAAQAQMIQGLRKYCQSKKITLRIEDPNLVDSQGNQPAWFKAFLAGAAQQGIALPILVCGHDDGEQVTGVKIVALPESSDDAIAWLKSQGG